MDTYTEIFTDDVLRELFPAQRADDFFEALFGDASEGAYDISLVFTGCNEQSNTLHFNLDLHERPGCCLACNLTYGLPEVFSRHPVINISGRWRILKKNWMAGPAALTGNWAPLCSRLKVCTPYL